MSPKKKPVKKTNAANLFPDFLDLYKQTSVEILTAIKGARSEIAALNVRVNDLEIKVGRYWTHAAALDKTVSAWTADVARMHQTNVNKIETLSVAVHLSHDDVNKIHNTLRDIIRLYDKTVMPLANAVSNFSAK